MLKKKLLAAVLTLAVLLGLSPGTALATDPPPAHSHPVCGAECSHAGSHGDVEWKALTRADFTNQTNGVTMRSSEYFLDSGNYYLEENIEINAEINVPSGTTVNLCLNGKKLSGDSNAPNYFFDVLGTLTLCSCDPGGGEVSSSIYRTTTCIQIGNSSTTVNLYGVKVTGKAGIHNCGTLTISGGEVTGSSFSGISNSENAKLTLIGNPIITGGSEDLELKTSADTTLEDAMVDATEYTGNMLRVEEYIDTWVSDKTAAMSAKIGAYAIKGGEGKFTLTNTCFKYMYESGGMVIRGDHTGGTATCTDKAVCTVCHQSYGDLADHTWGEDYEKDASQHWQKCTVCQSEDTKEAHTPGDWIIDQAATLEAEGSRHKECTVCRYTTETETIPKLEQPVHIHQYGAWTSDAASHWHQCTAADCTDLEGSKKDSAAHTEDAGTVTKPATSTEKGVKTFQCTVCGRVLRTEDIPELTEPTFSISGAVTNKENLPVSGVRVTLKKGSDAAAETQTDAQGNYSFANVPAGTYNVVAEKDGVTKTILVELTDANAENRNIQMPDGNKNSVVEVKGGDTPAVVVGGVDEIAENQEVTPDQTVTVKLTVEKKVEDAVRSDAAAIKRAAIGKTVEFLDFSLTKQVNDQNPEAITDTQNTVLEIVVSYDFSGKKEVTVYRHHGSSAAALANANTKADGTFRLDEGKGLIYIYASKFSTYAIGYTASGSETPDPKPPAQSSGGGSSSPASYPPVIEKSFHGKAEVQPRNPERGEKVTVTLTPDTGYQADRLTVTDRNGKPVAVTDEGGGRYTFIQPNGKVTIQAGFRPNDGYAVCPKNSVCPISPYTDASAAAWYHDGIHYCLDHNLMVGLDDHTFAPGQDTSRAMVAVILWRMEGSPLSDSPLPFADVAEGTWYTEAVRWAAASGVAGGYDGAVFGPGNPITREQMAAMLYRYEQYRGGGFTGAWTFRLDFEDAAQVSEWAREPMCWMTMNGIIDGIGNNTENAVLAPRGRATRAQTAAMLMRFCTKQ